MKEGKRVWNWLLFFVCAAVLTVGLVTQAACARSVFAPPAVSCAGDAGAEKTLIPVGRTVGIKLFSKGVMVVALSEIQTTEGVCGRPSSAVCKRGTSSPKLKTNR